MKRPAIGTFVLRTVPLVAIVCLLWQSAPRWPDDWDGLGFLASIDHFDLDKFAPHPPGYPVYVALLKLASLALHEPVAAATFVSIASALATFLLVRATTVRLVVGFRIREKQALDEHEHAAAGAASASSAQPSSRARARKMPRYHVPVPADLRALVVAFAVTVTPLVWRVSSGVGTEALALAFVALAAWGLALQAPAAENTAPPPRPAAAILVGIAVGLGLGVRLSWAPLYLPLLLLNARGQRLRAAAVAALAIAAWAVPLFAWVGPAHLVELTRVHFAGHAARWGGTALTEPGIARLGFLARDVLIDGFGGGGDVLGMAIATLGAMVGLASIYAWSQRRWRGAPAAALVLVPYAIWIALGQNLRQQPRHALPLVVALTVGLALGAASVGRLRLITGALLLLVAVRTGQEASDRRSMAPPGAQLVEWFRHEPERERAAVFGGATMRFFEGTDLAARAKLAGTVGDVTLALSKMRDYPDHVFVTSEVERLEELSPPPKPVATLCRPERIDRRAPCVTVYEIGAR